MPAPIHPITQAFKSFSKKLTNPKSVDKLFENKFDRFDRLLDRLPEELSQKEAQKRESYVARLKNANLLSYQQHREKKYLKFLKSAGVQNQNLKAELLDELQYADHMRSNFNYFERQQQKRQNELRKGLQPSSINPAINHEGEKFIGVRETMRHNSKPKVTTPMSQPAPARTQPRPAFRAKNDKAPAPQVVSKPVRPQQPSRINAPSAAPVNTAGKAAQHKPLPSLPTQNVGPHTAPSTKHQGVHIQPSNPNKAAQGLNGQTQRPKPPAAPKVPSRPNPQPGNAKPQTNPASISPAYPPIKMASPIVIQDRNPFFSYAIKIEDPRKMERLWENYQSRLAQDAQQNLPPSAKTKITNVASPAVGKTPPVAPKPNQLENGITVQNKAGRPLSVTPPPVPPRPTSRTANITSERYGSPAQRANQQTTQRSTQPIAQAPKPNQLENGVTVPHKAGRPLSVTPPPVPPRPTSRTANITSERYGSTVQRTNQQTTQRSTQPIAQAAANAGTKLPLTELFGSNLKKVTFKQRNYNTCYLLSGLDAILHHPQGEKILNLIDFRKTANGYLVKFPGHPEPIQVLDETLKNNQGVKSAHKGIPLLEQAYLQLAKSKDPSIGPDSYGVTSDALKLMFGKRAEESLTTIDETAKALGKDNNATIWTVARANMPGANGARTTGEHYYSLRFFPNNPNAIKRVNPRDTGSDVEIFRKAGTRDGETLYEQKDPTGRSILSKNGQPILFNNHYTGVQPVRIRLDN